MRFGTTAGGDSFSYLHDRGPSGGDGGYAWCGKQEPKMRKLEDFPGQHASEHTQRVTESHKSTSEELATAKSQLATARER